MFHRPTSTNQPASQTAQGENAMNQTNQPNTEANDQNDANRNVDIPATGGNPFQRPNPAQAAASNANRTGMPSYGSYSNFAAAPSATGANATGRRLVIGEGITMSGEIESCDTLVVEGTVEAALKGASILEIAEKGMFYGTVEISEATIAGKFEGELTVNGRLTIRATGSVVGAVTYKELSVEAGATIDGKVNPVGGARGGSSEKKPLKGKLGNSDFSGKAKAQQNDTDDLPILQRAAG
jgi:cytoskeletal protein CcmA (bactofilin family)